MYDITMNTRASWKSRRSQCLWPAPCSLSCLSLPEPFSEVENDTWSQSKADEEDDALGPEEVVITLADKELIIHNPSVAKVTMAGQTTFQIMGQVEERAKSPEIIDEDIQTVLGQVEVTEDEAREALLNADGDIAQAILDLQKE